MGEVSSHMDGLRQEHLSESVLCSLLTCQVSPPAPSGPESCTGCVHLELGMFPSCSGSS